MKNLSEVWDKEDAEEKTKRGKERREKCRHEQKGTKKREGDVFCAVFYASFKNKEREDEMIRRKVAENANLSQT